MPSTVAGSRAEPATSTSNIATTEAKPAAQAADLAQVKKEESGQKMQFSEFQNILGNLSGAHRAEIDLAEIISLDVMAPILGNKEVQERLMQHLPESEILPKTEHEIRTTLTTPQFKKAMSSFGHALQSGQLGPLLQQFNLPEEVSLAAAQGNLEAFAKAMENYSHQKKSEKKSDDDAMDTK